MPGSADVLEAITGLEPARLSKVLEEAVRGAILTPARGTTPRYAFAHALMREALYEELPATGRAALHRAAGEALERLAGDDVDAHLDLLAYHFVMAGPHGDRRKAVDYAERAGHQALAPLGYEDAVSLGCRWRCPSWSSQSGGGS